MEELSCFSAISYLHELITAISSSRKEASSKSKCSILLIASTDPAIWELLLIVAAWKMSRLAGWTVLRCAAITSGISRSVQKAAQTAMQPPKCKITYVSVKLGCKKGSARSWSLKLFEISKYQRTLKYRYITSPHIPESSVKVAAFGENSKNIWSECSKNSTKNSGNNCNFVQTSAKSVEQVL